MKRLLTYLILITVVSAAVGCGGGEIVNSDAIKVTSYQQISKIEVDSFRYSDITYRGADLLVMRFFTNDTTKSIPILIRRDVNDLLKIRVGSEWSDMDSFNYTLIGVSRAKIEYCENVMEEFGVFSINNSGTPFALFLDMNKLRFIYVYNEEYYQNTYIHESYDKLDSNWWVQKENINE